LLDLLVNDDLKVEFVYVAGGERALGHAEDEVAKFEKGKKHELEKLIFSNRMRTVEVPKRMDTYKRQTVMVRGSGVQRATSSSSRTSRRAPFAHPMS
jgi:hypothetical protein